MEYLFQADIDGSLERLTRSESDQDYLENRSSVDIILHSLKATLESIGSEQQAASNLSSNNISAQQDATNVCHRVLFNAWIRKEDALTSFSVSRYTRGILASEYYQIVETLGMTNYFKLSMYSLDPKTAAVAFKELLLHVDTSRLYDYLPTYLRICNGIESQELYGTAMDYMCDTLNIHKSDIDTLLVQQLLTTIQDFYTSNHQRSSQHCRGNTHLLITLYNTAYDIITKTMPRTWNKLIGVAHGKHQDTHSDFDMHKLLIPLDKLATKQNVVINVSHRLLRDNATDRSMSDKWNSGLSTTETPYGRHVYAFELICESIWKNAVPSQDINITSNQLHGGSEQSFMEKWTSACQCINSHLSSMTLEKKIDIGLSLFRVMEKCLKSLTKRHGSWKSIIKAMTQFLDLWVRILETKECMAAFAQLIVLTGSWTYAYQFTINIINIKSKDGKAELVTHHQKMALSQLVHLVIEQMETGDLLQLVYETYSKRSFPTDQAGKLDLFDDMATLKKCCNQFVQTRNDDDRSTMAADKDHQVEPRIINQLAKLAALSPYVTISTLVNQGLENKGQHDLVVSILRQLGDLCMLQRYPGDKTLLGHVIEQSLLAMNRQDKSPEMLALMLLECWKDARDPNTSILLDSYATFAANTKHVQVILQPEELFNRCLLPIIDEHKDDRPLINNILGLINTLTEDTSMMATKWQHQLQQHVSHIPILLDMDFDILMEMIATMMEERYRDYEGEMILRTHDYGVANISGLSIAIELGRKLIMAVKHVSTLYENVPEKKATVTMKMSRCHAIYDFCDWQTKSFWWEIIPITLDDITWGPILSDDEGDDDGDDDDDDDGNYVIGIKLSSSESWHYYLRGSNDWEMILNLCRSSLPFAVKLFEEINAKEMKIKFIEDHPLDSTSLYNLLVRNLHPVFFVAVHYEFKLLLDDFMDLVYDYNIHVNNAMMLQYQYGNHNVMTLVKLLTDEHCRVFFKALHALLLLDLPEKVKFSSDNTASADLHYVLSIVDTIQNMANWQALGKENTTNAIQSLARRHISIMADRPKNRMEDQSTDTSEIVDLSNKVEVVDCYYPWVDENRQSGRALCLLMIHYICSVSKSLVSQRSYDVIRVLLLQMVEGLEDRQERDMFMQHAKQTKSVINRWKKNKRDKRIRVHLRPLLNVCEIELVKGCYKELSSTEDQAVLLTLVNHPPSSTPPILYSYHSFN
ncbi:hypothetical protein BC941DRAFT_501283 [Chlamydoabsidia padenii]|nr:hypothetical protein BC941DRAFT_501283 [Chlamydoabsidia padenii]